jgi:hypothetical protein
MSERNPQLLSHLNENGADRFPQMDVLVGIEMTGTVAHEVMKHRELVGDFIPDSVRLLQGDYSIEREPFSGAKDLFAQIDMEPNAKARMFPSIC